MKILKVISLLLDYPGEHLLDGRQELAQAITAVAEADAEVKGAGRDPVYAVERAVLRICAATQD